MTKLNTRLEDQRLVTGRGCYAADWSLAGELHACFVRSDRAHADIVRLDLSVARALPGVVAILTAEDVDAARFASLPCSLPFTGIGGQSLIRPERPVLARGRVHYVGEPIACVIAVRAAVAADGAALIDVTYRELPAVIDMRRAMLADAPRIHAAVARNVCFEYEIGDSRMTAQAFERAPLRTRLALTHQRLIGSPMEPRACVVSFDDARGHYTIYTNTQGVNAIRG